MLSLPISSYIFFTYLQIQPCFFLSLSLKKKKPKNQETKTNHKALQKHRIKSQTQANGQ